MLKKVRKHYTNLKWVMLILLFILVLLTAVSRYLSFKFKPIAKDLLKELVTEATDGLYRLEFSDIQINVLTGRASLSDVKIIPDTLVFQQLIAKKKAPITSTLFR